MCYTIACIGAQRALPWTEILGMQECWQLPKGLFIFPFVVKMPGRLICYWRLWKRHSRLNPAKSQGWAKKALQGVKSPSMNQLATLDVQSFSSCPGDEGADQGLDVRWLLSEPRAWSWEWAPNREGSHYFRKHLGLLHDHQVVKTPGQSRKATQPAPSSPRGGVRRDLNPGSVPQC